MAEIKKYKGTLSESQYLDNLAKQNPYYDETLASNPLYGNSYTAMLADYSIRPEALDKNIFTSRQYAFLNDDEKIGFLLNEYSKKSISDEEYQKNANYFNAVTQSRMYDAAYEDLTGFEQVLNTTGSLLGKMLYSSTGGFLDGISDAGHLIGGAIAEWTTGHEGLALDVVKESDLWGIDTAVQDYWNEYDARYTALGRGKTDFGNWALNALNSLSENVGKLIPGIVMSVASSGSLAPVASVLYYASTAGDTAENIAESGLDVNALQALSVVAFDTAIEVLTEKIGGITPAGFQFSKLGAKATSIPLAVLFSGLGEGAEEMLAEVLQHVSHTAINSIAGKKVVDADLTVESLFTAGLLGVVMGGGFTAGQSAFVKVDLQGTAGNLILKGSKAFKFTGYSEILNDLSSQNTAVESLKMRTGIVETSQLMEQYPEEYKQAQQKDAKRLAKGAKAIATIKAIYETVGEKNFVDAINILDATQQQQIEQIRAYNDVHRVVSGLDGQLLTDVTSAIEEYQKTYGDQYVPKLGDTLAEGQRNSLLKKQVATVWENITGKKVIFIDGFTGTNGIGMHIDLASTENYVFVDVTRYNNASTIGAVVDAVNADIEAAVFEALENSDTVGKIKKILPDEYKKAKGALNKNMLTTLLFADKDSLTDFYLQDHSICVDVLKALKTVLSKPSHTEKLNNEYRKNVWQKISFVKQTMIDAVVSTQDASVVENDLSEAEIPITEGDINNLEQREATLDNVLSTANFEAENEKQPYIRIGLDLDRNKLNEISALTDMLADLSANMVANNQLNYDDKSQHILNKRIFNPRSYRQDFLESLSQYGWHSGIGMGEFVVVMNRYLLDNYSITYHQPTSSLFFSIPLDNAINRDFIKAIATIPENEFFTKLNEVFTNNPSLSDCLSSEFVEKYVVNNPSAFKDINISLNFLESADLNRAGSFDPKTKTLTIYTQAVEWLAMLKSANNNNVTIQQAFTEVLYHEAVHALQTTEKFYGVSYTAIKDAVNRIKNKTDNKLYQEVENFYKSKGISTIVDADAIADFVYKLTLGEQIAHFEDVSELTDSGFYVTPNKQNLNYTLKGYGNFKGMSLQLKSIPSDYYTTTSQWFDNTSDVNRVVANANKPISTNKPLPRATKATKFLDKSYDITDFNEDEIASNFFVKKFIEQGSVADYKYYDGVTYTSERNLSLYMQSDYSKYQAIHSNGLATFANMSEKRQIEEVRKIASYNAKNPANRINQTMALIAIAKGSFSDDVKTIAYDAINDKTHESATVLALAKNLKTKSSVIEYVGTMVRKMYQKNTQQDFQFTEEQLVNVANIVLGSPTKKLKSREELKKTIRDSMSEILTTLGVDEKTMAKILRLPDLSMASDYMLNYKNFTFYELHDYVQAYQRYQTINNAIDGDTEACINAIGTAYFEKQSEIIDTILKGTGADPTVWEYLDAYRYLAMLSAPSTWLKNATTNVMLKGLNAVSDKVAKTIEVKIFNKLYDKLYQQKISDIEEEIQTLEKLLNDTDLSEAKRAATQDKIDKLGLQLSRRRSQPLRWRSDTKNVPAKLRENLKEMFGKDTEWYKDLRQYATGSKYVIVDNNTNEFVEKTRATPSKDIFKKQQRAKDKVVALNAQIAKVESRLKELDSELLEANNDVTKNEGVYAKNRTDTNLTQLEASKDRLSKLNAEKTKLNNVLNGVVDGATKTEKAGLYKELERYSKIAETPDNIVFKVFSKYSEFEELALDDSPFTTPTLINYFKQLIEANWDRILVETKAYVQEKIETQQKTDVGTINRDVVLNALDNIDALAEAYDVESILQIAPPSLIASFKKFATRMATDAYLRGSTQMYKALMNAAQNHKGLRVAVKLIAPFARTSLNVAHMIWDYSPFGFLTARFSQDSKATLKMLQEASLEVYDDFKVADMSKKYAKAFVGTVGYIVGIILAALGVIQTDEDDYLGQVVKIGNIKFRLSDLSPAITPVITGAAILNYIRDTDSDTMEKIYNIASIIYEPTLLGTVEGYVQYGDGLMSIITDIGLSYFYSYIPAIVNASAKVIDPAKKRKSTNTFVRFYQNLLQRIPFASMLVPNKIDPYTGEAYGQGIRADGSGDIWYNFTSLLNVVSPVKMTRTTQSNVQKAFELYGARATTSTGNFTIKQYVRENGKLVEKEHSIKLDGIERQSFEMMKAYYLDIEYEKLIKSRTYIKASEAEKRAMLNSLNSNAFQYAKVMYWLDKGEIWYETSEIVYKRLREYINDKDFVFKPNMR